jgi:large subunit ribosomal protein L35
MCDSPVPPLASDMLAGGPDRSIWRTTMPKQKTHKGSKKRFRITARGKVMHRQAGTSHLNSRLTKKRRRNLRGTRVLDGMDANRITIALAGDSY